MLAYLSTVHGTRWTILTREALEAWTRANCSLRYPGLGEDWKLRYTIQYRTHGGPGAVTTDLVVSSLSSPTVAMFFTCELHVVIIAADS